MNKWSIKNNNNNNNNINGPHNPSLRLKISKKKRQDRFDIKNPIPQTVEEETLLENHSLLHLLFLF